MIHLGTKVPFETENKGDNREVALFKDTSTQA